MRLLFGRPVDVIVEEPSPDPDQPYQPGEEPIWLANLLAEGSSRPDGGCGRCGGWTFLDLGGRECCHDCGCEETP